jgi:hypothetical protein
LNSISRLEVVGQVLRLYPNTVSERLWVFQADTTASAAEWAREIQKFVSANHSSATHVQPSPLPRTVPSSPTLVSLEASRETARIAVDKIEKPVPEHIAIKWESLVKKLLDRNVGHPPSKYVHSISCNLLLLRGELFLYLF